jgi:Ca-activated chloride channel family protein
VVKLQMVNHTLHRGELVELRAQASSSTRTLTARLSGPAYASLPVTLRWTPAVSLDTGKLPVPADLPAGRYTLVLTAEDIAHNLSTEEVTVDVLP